MNDRLPMGAPNAGLIADIFMDYLETKILITSHQPIIKLVKLWKRYVDDIICIWNGGFDLLKVFHNHINNYHKNINFTTEIENNQTINFLDLKLIKNKINMITYDIIPASSNHHHRHKLAALQYYINRSNSIPLSPNKKQTEIQTIKQIAYNNGYNDQCINKILYKQPKSINNNHNEQIYKKFTLQGPIMYKIEKIVTKYNIKSAFEQNNNLL